MYRCTNVAATIGLLFVYATSFVVLLASPKYRSSRKSDLANAWRVSILAFLLLGLLSILSNPLGSLHSWLVGEPSTPEQRKKQRALIDMWILFWAGFDFLLLVLVVPKYPLL